MLIAHIMNTKIPYFVIFFVAFAGSDERCDYGHHKKGYATSCRNECPRHHPNRPPKVKDNTPSLKLNRIKTKPKDDAGLCKDGICVPYYDLKHKDPQVEEKAFPNWLHKCRAKPHTWPPVKSCYYYCRRNGYWYYGWYKRNTRCVGASPRPVGFCCYGKCYTRKEFCEK
ncbi:uncharacterized protein LOC144141282 [Haemaphysalis longicornis]